MKTGRSIWAVAKADFLDRTRRFSFLAISALTVFASFWCVPKKQGFRALVIEPNVFIQGYDASWVPMSAAMCGGMLMCIIGFVYIKNAVRLDRETGVMPLLQTSQLRRITYFFGKLISNFFLLSVLFAAVVLGACIMLLIQYPGQLISPYDFFTPFFCVLPGLVFISALALFMEAIPFFNCGAGSGIGVAIFLSIFILILTFGSMGINPYRITSVFDFSGYMWLTNSIDAAVIPITGAKVTSINVFAGGGSYSAGANLKPLTFHGLMPSAEFLWDKAVLIIFSFALTALAAVLLPRREKAAHTAKTQKNISTDKKHNSAAVPQSLRYIPVSAVNYSICAQIGAQLRMMLKQSVFWRIVSIGLFIACVFSPLETVRGTLLPLSLGWMLPVLSQMGCREHQCGMLDILRTIKNAPARQALACLHSGVSVSIITALPFLVRTLIFGQKIEFIACFIFVMFVPSLALFLGELTKTNRAFEIVFLFLCYIMMNIPSLIIPTEFSVNVIVNCVVLLLAAIVMLSVTLGKRAIEK